MIRKNLYISCIEAIEEFDRLEDELFNLGIDTLNCVVISNVVDKLEELLEYCTEDNEEDVYHFTDLGYYLYGGDKEEDRMWDGEGTVIPMRDAEDLWNYIASEKPHIVDKS